MHCRPYFEMKAQFNQMLEQQKTKVQNLESQVSTSKLTYADALRNLEQISDEIHRSRSKSHTTKPITPVTNNKQKSFDTLSDDLSDFSEEYKSLPKKLSYLVSPVNTKMEDVDGYKSVNMGNNASPVSPLSQSEKSDLVGNPAITQSRSSEWTEINLDVSSPEDDIPYKRMDGAKEDEKPKLVRQKTLPNPKIEHEFSSIKSKMKLDATISNWISRSSAKNDMDSLNNSMCALLSIYKIRQNDFQVAVRV